jgi:hypothetical protein
MVDGPLPVGHRRPDGIQRDVPRRRRPLGPLLAEPDGEPLHADLIRRGLAAELRGQTAQDEAIDAAGARLLGSAQGSQVGIDGAAERDVTGGRDDAAADFRNSPLSITGIPQGNERCGGPGMSLRGCQVPASCPVSSVMVAVMRWPRRGGWPRPGPGGTASGSCRRRCSGRRFGAAAGRAWRRRSSGRR